MYSLFSIVLDNVVRSTLHFFGVVLDTFECTQNIVKQFNLSNGTTINKSINDLLVSQKLTINCMHKLITNKSITNKVLS